MIRRLHPEEIPWPGSALYNELSHTSIFLRHYELVAQDVANYGTARGILDIGTGPGQLLLALRDVFPTARIVGVDISHAMVAQAHRNLGKSGLDHSIEVRAASATELPFADGTFDRVVSTGSLHHWKDPVRALSEVHRILKFGGYALLYDLVRDVPKEIRGGVRTHFGSFRLALLWLHSFEEPFLDVQDMIELGRRTDLKVEGTKFVGALCCLISRKI